VKRKFLILVIGIMVGCSSLFFSLNNSVQASQTNKQLEEKKKDVQSKRSNVKTQISDTQNKVDKINAEQASTENEIKKLDFAVADTNSKIREKEAQIKEATEIITKLRAEIEVLKEQIKKRDELLKVRVRSMQENGMIDYLDVLLGAQSFGDFIGRVSAVTTFMEADRELLRAHQEDKEQLDKKEAEVQAQLKDLSNKKAQLEEMKKTLDRQLAEKNTLLAQLNKQEEEAHEMLGELEDQEAILAAQEKAIKREIEAWNRKQRELEAQRKKQQASGGGQAVGAAPAVTNGIFMNPTTGSLTSHYGQRWGTLHSGIDIGKGGRTEAVPIVAAASGTVIRANYDRSYGNVVMITHVINGQVMTTVYGHMERLFVSNGQRVEKGQTVGYMGSTGNSTGPHLHFEVHIGPWNGARSNSVNPLKYVSY